MNQTPSSVDSGRQKTEDRRPAPAVPRLAGLDRGRKEQIPPLPSVIRHPSSVRDRGGTAVRIIRYFRQLRGGPGDCGETFPYRLTASGAWAASRPEHLFYFFKTVDLSRVRLFIDLGSGDGGACCVAALFTRSIGIESDPFLASRAERAGRDLDLHARAGFICADFLTQRIQKADCLFIYPDKPIDVLEKTLESWGGILLVYGPHFPPRGFSLLEKLRCGRETMSVYRIIRN